MTKANPRSGSAGPDYGIDAPGVIRGLFAGGLAMLAVGLAAAVLLWGSIRWLAVLLLAWGILGGLSCLLTAAAMLWSSGRGKLLVRDRVIGTIAWRGDESVLDLGCGHGLMLLAAAKRVPRGLAVGIDRWRQSDQAANSPAAALANAEAEGVADRVAMVSGDFRSLPFADASFDVILASLAVHNVPDRAGRDEALAEAARTLRPGGHIALIDFQGTADYAETLARLGLVEVARSPRSWSMFPPVRLVTAGKRSDASLDAQMDAVHGIATKRREALRRLAK